MLKLIINQYNFANAKIKPGDIVKVNGFEIGEYVEIEELPIVMKGLVEIYGKTLEVSLNSEQLILTLNDIYNKTFSGTSYDKIEMIKLIRKFTPWSLKKAKAYVEYHYDHV